MDRFLKPKNSSHAATKTTADARQPQFPSTTHVSGGKLFCTTCNMILDHTRKSTVATHMTSAKHGASLKQKASEEASGKPAKRQVTLTDTRPASVAAEERNSLCQEWVSMLPAANIPLSKTDHPAVRQFLQNRVMNGGSIPGAKQLQECYLQKESSKRIGEVKDLLKDKPVAIVTDEMSDANGRYVLNVLAAPLQLKDGAVKTYLLDTVFLEATNHSTVAAAVVKTVTNFEIDYQNVIVFNTDNAAYMHKAYDAVLKGLFGNSIHITCLAHITNLLGEAFKKPFVDVTRFVRNMNSMFWNSGGRKARYLRHLKGLRPDVTPKLPPNPVATRWNCYYDAVDYHLKHMDLYWEFLEAEIEHAKSQAPNSLKELHVLFEDSVEVSVLKAQMLFIQEKSSPFISASDFFQSQSAVATNVWSKLQDLQYTYHSGTISLLQAERYFEDTFSSRQKTQLMDLFNQAYALVSEKMDKYMTKKGQPGIEFLRDVQFFNPSKVVVMPRDASLLPGVPGIDAVPAEELARYTEDLAPGAVNSASASGVNVELFWKSCRADLPQLSSLALRYIFATVNSADAERSFSLYNLVHSERRRSLGQDTIRQLLFLYCNKFAGRDFFD